MNELSSPYRRTVATHGWLAVTDFLFGGRSLSLNGVDDLRAELKAGRYAGPQCVLLAGRSYFQGYEMLHLCSRMKAQCSRSVQSAGSILC